MTARSTSSARSAPRRVVARDAALPEGEGEGERDGGDEGHEPEFGHELLAVQETNRRIERSERERDDEGERDAHPGIVDRQRVTAELHQVEDGRRDPDPVLDPEGGGGQADEDRKIDRRAADRPRDEEEDIQRVKRESEPPGGPDDGGQARDRLLERLEAEGLEEHLEDRRHRAQQYPVEPSLDQVAVGEEVEVPGEDVEEPERHEREAIEKYHLFELPTLHRRHAREDDQQETERRRRPQKRRQHRGKEVRPVLQAGLG